MATPEIQATIYPERGEPIELPSMPYPPTSPWTGYGLGHQGAGALEGWYESPAPRAESITRPQADGAYTPWRLLVGARVLTLVFHHRARGPVEVREIFNQVMGLVKQWVRVAVREPGTLGTKHVRGFISEQPEIVRRDERTYTFTLVVTCPDPLKYAGAGSDDEGLTGWEMEEGRWTTRVEGGLLFPIFDQDLRPDVVSRPFPVARFTESLPANTITIKNRGNTATWPVLEAVGPLTWAQWESQGQVVRWEGEVAPGRTLRINTHTGAVTLAGEKVSPAGVVHPGFFQLNPGETTLTFTASDEAVFRVRWMSAWM